MPVALVPATRDNDRAVGEPPVEPDDDRFVVPRTWPLVTAACEPVFTPRAIAADGAPAGFCRTERDPATGAGWIYGLKFAADFRGREIGRAAMERPATRLRRTPRAGGVFTSFAPENRRAARLYPRTDFRDTGRRIGAETVAYWPLPTAGDATVRP